MGGGYGEKKVASACSCLMVILLVVTSAPAEAALSCGQVLSSVSACLSYLKDGGDVTPACCDGLKSLTKVAAATDGGLESVCSCTKSLQPSVGAKTEFINGLPIKCGVKFPYKYSPSMDCSKLKTSD